MSSPIKKKMSLTKYSMQPYGPPCRVTISVSIKFASLSDKTTSAVEMNGSMDGLFSATV